MSSRTQPALDRATPFPQAFRHARGDGAGRGRTREAVHQRLAVHQVRGGQPALHDGQRPGTDFERIRQGLTLDYPRAADMPGAGFAAGPCLFKDTLQLAAYNNNNFALGHMAMSINEGFRSTWWTVWSSVSICHR